MTNTPTQSTTIPWLRVEGAAVLAGALVGYDAIDGSWLLLAALLLVPDLAMLGYLAGTRVGAVTYNTAHLYLWPLLLLAAWTITAADWALAGSLIWAAHIGMDRALGYGLKEPDAFQHTHLGWIGGVEPSGGAEDGRPAGDGQPPRSSSTIGP